VTTRATRTSPWASATNLGSKLNSSYVDGMPSVSSHGLELYFGSTRPGGYGGGDLYVSKRATPQDLWGDPVNLGPVVNSAYHDDTPNLSPDGLLLLFESNRPGGYGKTDLWMTRRASHTAPWGPVVNLGPIINSSEIDCQACLAPDGSALYFAWNWFDRPDRPWRAPILPIVDFNADGKVDGKEVLAMAQHWGQNKSLYDIGLTPMGDGIVDANDLTVLAGYIGQDVNDPTLIAHWALDEAAGMTAADSAGTSDGTVMGEPLWQPTGGKIGGALQFDGNNDFVMTGFAWNPSDNPYSVFAWVKGGAAGQVILSQKDGVNWLMARPATGALATELKAGLGGKVLSSSVVITDGQWHRVGFVRDGTSRILYVDGVEAARDTQSGIAGSTNGLYIGAGSKLTAGTFWSGLIDDVRIYNRAVQP